MVAVASNFHGQIFLLFSWITWKSQKFPLQIFLTALLSTGLNTSKSQNDESQKSTKITKIFNYSNLELL